MKGPDGDRGAWLDISRHVAITLLCGFGFFGVAAALAKWLSFLEAWVAR